MNLLEELERENSKFRVGDGSRSARPKYHLYEIKKAISSAREELTKRSECSGCMTKPCTCYWERTVNLDDINEVLGDGK